MSLSFCALRSLLYIVRKQDKSKKIKTIAKKKEMKKKESNARRERRKEAGEEGELPGGGKCWLLTTRGNLVSRANVQCLLTRSNMVSWSLYYTAVGHHVNPGIIHHTQECTHTHTNTQLQPQICHCKSCRTSCLSEAKLLYYILNQGSIVVLGEEHQGCLVMNIGLQIEAIMASWIYT